MNEKVQNTGEPMPIFLGVDLIVFSAFHKGTAVFSEHWADSDLHCNCCAPHLFFQILSPPPPPSQGICCFSKHWADSDLHCTCCAPHMGTLPKHQEDDKEFKTYSKEQGV